MFKIYRFRSQNIKNVLFNKRCFYSMPPPREPDPFFYGLLALGIIYFIKKNEPPRY